MLSGVGDGVEWMGDTPQTVMTTRAPEVLIKRETLTTTSQRQTKVVF